MAAWRTLLVFGLLGPVVGEIAFLLATLLWSGWRPAGLAGLFEAVWSAPGVIILGLPFAYLVGAVPAMVTGVLAAVIRRHVARGLFVAASSTVGAMASAGYMISRLGSPPDGVPLFVFALCGAVAGAVCALVSTPRPRPTSRAHAAVGPVSIDSSQWTGR